MQNLQEESAKGSIYGFDFSRKTYNLMGANTFEVIVNGVYAVGVTL